MRLKLGLGCALLVLSGCSADSPQVTRVGGGVLDVSSAGGVGLQQAAQAFCERRGARQVQPVQLQPEQGGADATHWGSRASHMQFRCLAPATADDGDQSSV